MAAMKLKAHFQLMARYNRWMNEKILVVAANLSLEELFQDRGAYFGSIGGTLNHILVGDIIWLRRFLNHQTQFSTLDPINDFNVPSSLDQQLYSDLISLAPVREKVDQILIDLCNALTGDDLDHKLSYTNTRGERFTRPFGALLLHVFNHQTHHRGQITTLFFQSGIDPGVTDLLELIPNTDSQ